MNVLKIIEAEVKNILKIKKVDTDANFFSLGLTSIQLMTLQERLSKKLNLNLYSTITIDYSTINRLAEEINKNHK